MLRFSLRVSRMDKIRNEYVRGTARVERFGHKVRETRLGMCGIVDILDESYLCFHVCLHISINFCACLPFSLQNMYLN